MRVVDVICFCRPASERFAADHPRRVEYVRMGRIPERRHESRQDRLAASSIWTRLSLVVVVAVPWILTLPSALFGVQTNAVAGLGALIGSFAGASFRDRDFLKLSGLSRRRVIAMQRSGQLSGDPILDKIALERLQRAARGVRSDRILLPILLIIYVATPVVAAVRDNGWWLLCLLPGAVAAAILPVTWPRQDPRVQRDRLLRAVTR